MAVRRFEPLIVESPSLALRPGTGMPALLRASLPGSSSPSKNASPSPIMRSAIWDIGARSPHAPTEPFWQTAGVTPLLSIATSVSTISGRHPDLPWTCTLMRPAIAPRTYSIGARSPIPAAWL